MTDDPPVALGDEQLVLVGVQRPRATPAASSSRVCSAMLGEARRRLMARRELSSSRAASLEVVGVPRRISTPASNGSSAVVSRIASASLPTEAEPEPGVDEARRSYEGTKRALPRLALVDPAAGPPRRRGRASLAVAFDRLARDLDPHVRDPGRTRARRAEQVADRAAAR